MVKIGTGCSSCTLGGKLDLVSRVKGPVACASLSRRQVEQKPHDRAGENGSGLQGSFPTLQLPNGGVCVCVCGVCVSFFGVVVVPPPH